MSGFVYILEDDLNKYYIGSCEDVDVRYRRHLGGWVYTTRRMKNPKIVFRQEFPTIQQAKKIELKLKRLKRKDYITKIIQDGKTKMKI
jgi:putative endonuclease